MYATHVAACDEVNVRMSCKKDLVTHALCIHLSSALSVGSRILQCKIRSSHVKRMHDPSTLGSQYDAHSTENVSI